MHRKPSVSITLALAAASVAAAGERPTVLLTGYWPPTNEMVRPFSTNPELNPDGWIGENWEGRGYDVHAFFPEFDPPDCLSCGQGTGDLEVDYQDTSADFWTIANGLAPIAIITFSRGGTEVNWELEMNQFNRDAWGNDFTPPLQPTPNPPDDSVPVGYLRPSQLPVSEIVEAINDSGLGLDSFVCFTGDGGGYLSEFIAYHGVWYQDLHSDPLDSAFCATAGHIHVGYGIPWPDARQATEITLRVVMDYLDQIEVDFYFPDGQPRLINPFGGTRVRVEVTGRTKDPLPDSGQLHYSTDGVGFTTVPMAQIETNVYEAVFPESECGNRVLYYFSVETAGGEVVFSPIGAPEATYGADAYNAEVLTFADDFETDLGWSVENDPGLTDGAWERGTPIGGPFAPDADGDGSGQCYVTGLAQGQDVDGFSSRLTSPVMDASDPASTLVFERWFAVERTGGTLEIWVSDDGGASWRRIELLNYLVASEAWVRHEFLISDLEFIDNTDAFRMRALIRGPRDAGTVEAGIDGVRIVTGFECIDPCTADLDNSGDIGFTDLTQLLSAWGACAAPCPEDLDGDGNVGFADLTALLSNWGPCS